VWRPAEPQHAKAERRGLAHEVAAEQTETHNAHAALRGADAARIHVFLATSDLHLERKLRISCEDAIVRVAEGIRRARRHCDDVEFSPEDASRTELDFLARVLEATIEAGATTINIPDTVGYTVPDEFGELFRYLRQNVRGIDKVRDGYASVVRRLVRVSALSVLLIGCFAVGAGWLSLHTPTGFLPEEDQGAYFISTQLPDGASVARTGDVVDRVQKTLHRFPEIQDTLSIIGFSLLDGAQEPNAALVVARLKPFGDRLGPGSSAQALVGKTFGAVQAIRSAMVFPFNLPPIIGLGTGGGFEYVLEALQGQDPVQNGQVMRGLVASANQDPRLARVFSTYTASNPSLFLDIDRDKAAALGLSISEVSAAVQATLGGLYVNNFNLFGRSWQVIVQADSQ